MNKKKKKKKKVNNKIIQIFSETGGNCFNLRHRPHHALLLKNSHVFYDIQK